MASVRGEAYLQLVGKMKFYQFTVQKIKLAFVLSVCTGIIFVISKNVHIFICIKTCHMIKSCKTTRIENHGTLILLIYPTKFYIIAAFYKNSSFKPLCGYPGLLEELHNK